MYACRGFTAGDSSECQRSCASRARRSGARGVREVRRSSAHYVVGLHRSARDGSGPPADARTDGDEHETKEEGWPALEESRPSENAGAALGEEAVFDLGHSDIKITMRYAHLAPDHLRAAVSSLDGVLTNGVVPEPLGRKRGTRTVTETVGVA
jgi:hypothetical protein